MLTELAACNTFENSEIITKLMQMMNYLCTLTCWKTSLLDVNVVQSAWGASSGPMIVGDAVIT